MSDAECVWCGSEGCGVCNEAIAERNRAKWRQEGTLRSCQGCSAELDVLLLEDGRCLQCRADAGGAGGEA